MEFNFTKTSVLKEAARAIRTHNYIHNKAERNAVLITVYLDFAADLIDKLANGNIAIVRHGHWISYKMTASSMCSKCKHVFTDETPFCPHCGAKMYATGGVISNERLAEIMKGKENE